MCGIAGILSTSFEQIQDAHLIKMNNAIAHRGPDGEGIWHNTKKNVLLGHRRLAIIDLSNAAAQPMHYLNRYTITYNGEIYNYIELKELLAKKGYQFNSKSDTEVILAAYDFWHEDCLKYFEGMFAFAIWDEAQQQIFAARDRFGEKPFYYHENDRYLVFASEMKSLWALGVQKSIDEKILLNYLALGHVQNASDKEQTFFNEIYSLPPAHYFKFSPSAKKLVVKKYWHLEKEKTIDISASEAVEKFNYLFTVSIKKRLRCDVSLGTSLSGGLDSSSILTTLQQINNNQQVKSFSAVFPNFVKDESFNINLLSNKLNIENFKAQPTADDLIKDFEKLCYHQEEPFQSASVYAQFKVFELAKQQQVKVLLDGQGADETLAGYHKYIHWFLQEVLSRHKLGENINQLKQFRKNNQPFHWGIKNHLAAFLPAQAALLLERKDYKKTANHPDIHPDFLQHLIGHQWDGIHRPIVTKLNDYLHFNLTEMGLEELLRFADRNSMAHGVEVRLPFLSHELVEFVFALPSTLKIHEGFTKWILRKLGDNKLPQSITWRKDKVGFEPPQKTWMQTKPFEEFSRASKQKLVDEKILSPKVLAKKAIAQDAHTANNFDWRYVTAAQFL